MLFQVGNKCAEGHGCGRPPKYDLEKEAQELLEWSKRDDAIHIKKFTFDKDYTETCLYRFAEKNTVFCEALKKARDRIAYRRDEYVNKNMLNYGVWNRYAAVYDKDLERFEEGKEIRKDERDYDKKKKLIEYELALKSQKDEASDVQKQSLDEATRTINYLQSKIDLNNAESNNSPE